MSTSEISRFSILIRCVEAEQIANLISPSSNYAGSIRFWNEDLPGDLRKANCLTRPYRAICVGVELQVICIYKAQGY